MKLLLIPFLLLAPLTAAQTLTWTDGTFSSWTSAVVYSANGSSGSGSAQPTGGNPGSTWRIDHQVAAQGGVAVEHHPTDPAAVFDPVSQGPFHRVDLSIEIETTMAAAFGGAVAFSWTARQGGLLFTLQCSYELVWQSTGWVVIQASAHAPEFRDYAGSAAQLDFDSGAPITFGVVSSNGTCCGAGVGEAFLDNYSVTLHVGSPVGTNSCQPTGLNSINSRSVVIATGLPQAGGMPLNLEARCLPPNQFGYFLVAPTTGLIANPGGSQGTLCLAGAIGRFNAQVQNSGAAGRFDIDVDTQALPTPTGTLAVQPGETWHFQCWYRDSNPGPTSNFTDAVSVMFN